MTTIVLTTNNKTDLKLFLDLAKRVGVQSKTLTDEEIIDAGLLKAMKEAKTTKIVSKSQIMKSLTRNVSKI